jgi:tartrate dehydratase beta subunit/fumarate hydratase class I family protein
MVGALAEILESRVIVITKGEMPPAVKGTVFDLAVYLVDIFGIAYLYHRTTSFS